MPLGDALKPKSIELPLTPRPGEDLTITPATRIIRGMMNLVCGGTFLADTDGGGILYAFVHSTLAGKAVLFTLMIGSIFSWAVMLQKIYMIRQAKADTRRFLRRFRSSRKPLTILQTREVYPDSPAYQVYVAGCEELCFYLLGSTEIDDTFAKRVIEARPVSAVAMSAVRSAMEREVGEQALKLEDRMTVLATAVSGAPFLGLLGTVWGVMDTFSGIAVAQHASLAAMAPGVSAALITTVTGLLVAIPAMFGYNFLVVTLRGMIVELDNFAAELASSLDHRFLEDGRRNFLSEP